MKFIQYIFWLILLSTLFTETFAWERKMCSFDVEIRNSGKQMFKSKNVKESRKDIMACTILDGDLTISMIHSRNGTYEYLVFENLIEITGSLLIYSVNNLKNVGEILPNLRVIDGNSLISNYSFVLYQNENLELIGLNKLSVIRNGGIRIAENPKLCYSKFINWDKILYGNIRDIVIEQSSLSFFPESSETYSCNDFDGCKVKDLNTCEINGGIPSCWNSSICQTYCPYHKLDNGLIGPGCTESGKKCHSSCLGGCFEANNSSSCYACQKFELNGTCVDECPPDMFVYKHHRCISATFCHNLYPVKTNSRRERVSWKAFQGKCHFECPEGFQEDPQNPQMCASCNGFCPEICLGGFVDTVKKAERFAKCNIIDGNLTVLLQFSENSGQQLKRAFGNIREIKGYLLIHYSPVITSLNMFQNLRIIYGDELINGRYALAIFEMQNLKQLFNNEIEQNLKILKGTVSFQNNPKLCFNRISKFIKNIGFEKNITDSDISKYSNGEKAICDEFELEVNVTNFEFSSFFLTWKKIDNSVIDESQLLGYIVYYKEVEAIDKKLEIDEDRCVCGDTWKKMFVQKNENDEYDYGVKIEEGINPNSIYAYYVQGQVIHHSEAKNAISKVGFVKTPFWHPDSPRFKRVVSKSPDSITLEWDPPEKENGVITNYLISWDALKNRENREANPCDSNSYIYGHSSIHSSPGNSKNVYPVKEKSADDKLQEKMHFEDSILNKIFPIPDTYPFHQIPENGKNRRIRSIPETESSNLKEENDQPFYKPFLNFYQSNMSGRVEIPSTTKYVISGLSHFTQYYIQIYACQDEKAKQHYCSSKSETQLVQTQPIPENDLVDAKTVKVKEYFVDEIEQEDCRILSWKIPDNPNGKILGFRYKLWRENESLSFDRCISHDSNLQHVKVKVKGLLNGFYTLEIRTISSAGISEGIILETLFEINVPGWLTWQKLICIITTCAIIISAIVWLIYRHYKQYLAKKLEEYLFLSTNFEYPQIDIYKKDEWELRREDLALFDEIGRGTFGKVYSGQGKDIISKNGIKFGKCAIKTIPECASYSERMHFLLEASVMKQFDTEFIVKLYGVISEGIPVLLVMEMMEQGNLRDFLRTHRPNAEENLHNLPLPSTFSYFKWACQIADGMAYLQATKFVHRDLAARNCMVSADETVKIGDFGMARDIYYHDYYKAVGRRFLPVRWMAPESLKDAKFTVKSDVWSYGIVIYEMITLGQQPYAGLRNEQVFEYIGRRRKVLNCPTNCPEFWYNLMKKCWFYDERERPCFYQIFLYLKDTIENNFKNINEEDFKVFENCFVNKNLEKLEKTSYNFAANETQEIRKHPWFEELNKVKGFEEDLHYYNDEAIAFMNDDNIRSFQKF